MDYYRLIARLRNRATVYAPQEQQEAMQAAAAAIERLIGIVRELDLMCDYCAHKDKILPECNVECTDCSGCICRDCTGGGKWEMGDG